MGMLAPQAGFALRPRDYFRQLLKPKLRKERETDPDTLTFYYSAITRLLVGGLLRPDRLLALPRKIAASEIASIFARVDEQDKLHRTVLQMKGLLQALPSSADEQRDQLRMQMEKLIVRDDSLREDLETVALDATGEDRERALAYLRSLPGWSDEDTASLESEIAQRRRIQRPEVSKSPYVTILYSLEDGRAAEMLGKKLGEISFRLRIIDNVEDLEKVVPELLGSAGIVLIISERSINVERFKHVWELVKGVASDCDRLLWPILEGDLPQNFVRNISTRFAPHKVHRFVGEAVTPEFLNALEHGLQKAAEFQL